MCVPTCVHIYIWHLYVCFYVCSYVYMASVCVSLCVFLHGICMCVRMCVPIWNLQKTSCWWLDRYACIANVLLMCCSRVANVLLFVAR